MVRGLKFRLLYRVIFFFFCLRFACFYHHGGDSVDDKQGDKTELIKLHDEFNSKHLNDDVFLKQNERVPNSTENAKHVDDSKTWKKGKLSRMVKKGKF